MIVGVVGGIASGKTTVVEAFKRNGACAIHADTITHAVLELPEVFEQIRARFHMNEFGYSHKYQKTVADSDGKLIRKVLGDIALSAGEMEFLETITAPHVKNRVDYLFKTYTEHSFHPMIVLDMPLLFEMGYTNWCRKMIFVNAERSVRVARYAERTQQLLGDADWKMAKLESRQTDLTAKQHLCHHVIENKGTKNELIHEALNLFISLTGANNVE